MFDLYLDVEMRGCAERVKRQCHPGGTALDFDSYSGRGHAKLNPNKTDLKGGGSWSSGPRPDAAADSGRARELAEAAIFPRESTAQSGARDEPKRHDTRANRGKAEPSGAELAEFDDRRRAPSGSLTISNRKEICEGKS